MAFLETEQILLVAAMDGVSDIFIIPGLPLTLKINNQIQRHQEDLFTSEDTDRIIHELYRLAQRSPDRMMAMGDDDFSFSVKGLSRYRVNIFRQRGSLAAVVRVIAFTLPNPEQLGIPDIVMEQGKKSQGLVLVTGPAGSGKSTTLRALAGIFSPDEGTINTHDNSISLLSIGVGFQSKLTGTENIYLSGLLLGFTEEYIKQKEREIIDFADIGDFINEPVETYSSGMHSKLAFAITAILETDIILIDEVLSVGDAEFREKSYNKMKELINHEERTVVIVSHSLGTIKTLCDEVLWIHEGLVKMHGKPSEVIKAYDEFMKVTGI